MSINTIVSEFQNYTINKSDLISANLNKMKVNNTIDENNLLIREYLLNEILILTNKALSNRFSADVLFQNNYWSWGIVTTYYSNFFLVQALNRLRGNFFTFINAYSNGNGKQGRRYIYLDNDGNFKLTSCPSGYTDSHGGELKKFKDNYSFLLSNSTVYNKFIAGLASNYPESTIRGDINYKLEHYKELSDFSFRNNLDFNKCKEIYRNYKNLQMSNTEKEFKMLIINRSRLELIFYILKEIKKTNSYFESEFDIFVEKVESQISYITKNEVLKYFNNKLNSNIKFHPITEMLKSEIKGLIK